MTLAAFILSVLALFAAVAALGAIAALFRLIDRERHEHEGPRLVTVDGAPSSSAAPESSSTVRGVPPPPMSFWESLGLRAPGETPEQRAYREATGAPTDAVIRGPVPADADRWDDEDHGQMVTPAPASKLRAEPPG